MHNGAGLFEGEASLVHVTDEAGDAGADVERVAQEREVANGNEAVGTDGGTVVVAAVEVAEGASALSG